MTIDLAHAVTALTDLGLGGVVGLGALVFVAGMVYKRFRK